MSTLKRFRVYDLMVIALMAALGIATKPLIVPLTHMITGPLFIPGGAIAGGFYMFWLVLAAGLIGKRGTASLVGLTQALMVIITGAFGSHGLVSIVTYSLPGLVIDGLFLIFRRRWTTLYDFFIAGVLANLTGTYLSNLVFFRLPLVPLLMSLAGAIFSGGLGGVIAYQIYVRINRISGRSIKGHESFDGASSTNKVDAEE